MRITYACPACHATVVVDGIEARATLDCPACGAVITVPGDAFTAGTPPHLRRCLVCPSTELFVRKDFPQRVGLAIVVAGLSPEWESEGFDRPTLDMPGRQNELVARVAAANPRTVVCIQAVRLILYSSIAICGV